MFSIVYGILIVFDVLYVDVYLMINVIHVKENFIVKMILSSKTNKKSLCLKKKISLFRKYIHRCFSCQNLIQSHEFIRRVRAGRIYHADCFMCIKCKRILQDDDIASIMPTDGSSLNDMDYLCHICSNRTSKLIKSSTGITNADEGLRKTFVFLKICFSVH